MEATRRTASTTQNLAARAGLGINVQEIDYSEDNEALTIPGFAALDTVQQFVSLIQPSSWPLSAQVGVVGAWLGLVVAIAASIRYVFKAKPEIIRKVVHIGTGNVILIAWALHVPTWLGIAASIVFSIITLAAYWFPILPFINSVGRKSLGTFFYSLSIGILIAWFWPRDMAFYAVLGVLTMSWGDGLAALVGQRWGSHRYELWGMKKSWEGSLTMMLATFVVSLLILGGIQGLSWPVVGVAGAIALGAATLEAFSKLGIDNLTVPLGSAAIAYGLTAML